MALIKVSNDFKKKFKHWFYIIVCILIYSWTTVCCAEMWLNCIILAVNNQNVVQDINSGNLMEVATIDSSGNFTLEGSSEEYTSADVTGYIRVPNDVKYYYNLETKNFVSKLTIVESRNVILKFFILDIVCTIMLIMTLVYAFRGGIIKKISSVLLYILSIFISQCAYEYAFDVLFDITEYLWVIILTKAVLVVIVFTVKGLIKKFKGSKKPKRLKKHR